MTSEKIKKFLDKLNAHRMVHCGCTPRVFSPNPDRHEMDCRYRELAEAEIRAAKI